MYAVYKMRVEELDASFLETLKSLFRNQEIEIAVCEAAASAEDETTYLLKTPANRDRLLRAIENIAHDREFVSPSISTS